MFAASECPSWQGSFALGQSATSVLISFLGNELGGRVEAFTALGIMALLTALGALIGKQIGGHKAYRLPPKTPATGH